jgi:hypothetical protein
MIVKYIDLETGQRAEERGISPYNLSEGNWSCDCNRQFPFGIQPTGNVCIGCKRFIAYSAEPEAGDEPFNEQELLAEANREYRR